MNVTCVKYYILKSSRIFQARENGVGDYSSLFYC
jgi:hypothetical protein